MINRILRHALLLGVVFACIAARPSALSAQLRHGDVSGEGVVSALDAQAILSSVVGLTLPGTFVPANGVADCTSGRTMPAAIDAQIVLMYVIGLNVSSYCVGQTFGPGATTVALTPLDSSVLIGSTRAYKAVLRQSNGQLIARPITWSSSAPSVAVLDSVKNDSLAFFHGVAEGSTTITAFADGTSSSTPLHVVSTYLGIVIQPQRGDTLNQIGGSMTFYARDRDAAGNLGAYRSSFWSSGDPKIITITSPASGSQNSATVQAMGTGTTWLFATSDVNPAFKDSVPVTVLLPTVNSCIAGTGSLHNNVTYTTPQTWTAATNPHFVGYNVQFNAGANLTIEPGALLCMQGGASIVLHNGARLTALGTVASPIRFVGDGSSTVWSQIQLGDYTNFSLPLTDTSRIKNAYFENTYSGITAYHQHVALLDSVHIRQFGYNAVELYAKGSQLIRSTIDSSIVYYNGTAATLYRGSVEATTIRLGTGGTGVEIGDSATVRAVSISEGTTGIAGMCCSSYGPRINDVTIANPSGLGLDFAYMSVHPSSANVQITAAGSYAFRGLIENVGILFPDSLAQETLKGHGRDTIAVNGGTLRNRNVLVRPDLPWSVNGYVYIDTLAQLVVHPGGRMRFSYGGLMFQEGGTLDARGTAANPIYFGPQDNSSYWYGLAFYSPGAGANPFNAAPTAQSTLTNARVDSAQGVGMSGGFGGSSAINAGDRHRLTLDSVTVHKAFNGAVYLAARRSSLSRSLIDTTGYPTTGYSAVALGDSVTMRQTRIRRAGGNANAPAIYASGTGARLINDTVHVSTGYGLYAQDGILDPDSLSVRIDSASYPARMRIENFAYFAPDSVTQLQFMGNTDSVVVVTGGNLTRDTVTAIPQLRWQVENTLYFDTLSHFAPRPGSRISAIYAQMYFRQGATLNAHGTATAPIRFYPVPGYYWYGLSFYSPGAGANPFSTAPVAQSYLINARVDSAQGIGTNDGFGSSAAINAGAVRHRLTADSVFVHKAFNGAIYLGTRGSSLSRSVIDTTGNPTTGYSAVALGDSVTMRSTIVRRAGGNYNVGAVYASGTGARIINSRIRNSTAFGLYAQDGILNPDSLSVQIDSSAYVARMRIENFAYFAGDSVSQLPFMGNTDSVVVITGGNLVRDTVVSIPQLRWQVENTVYFDTLSHFRARPGSRISAIYAQMYFRQGGTLDAHGSAAAPVRFYPVPGYYWYGLSFFSPDAGGNSFATAPVAQSYLINARVDSAMGINTNDGFYSSAAVNAGALRHRLIADSVVIHKAFNGAIYLGTRGSRLSRSLIDTTGNPTSSYHAVALGDTVTMEATVVRRAGGTGQSGVYAPGAGARLVNDTIVGGLNVGLWAQDGVLRGDSGSVVIRQNGYAARLRFENMGILVPDTLAQDKLLGNTNDLVVLFGGTLANATVALIKQLAVQVENTPVVGTNARFQPHAGARMFFYNSGMTFNSGGTLNATGTRTDSIRFKPSGTQGFYGLRFDNPVTGEVSSQLAFVRMDSASGVSSTYWASSSAINASDRHLLTVSNSVIRQSWNGALLVGAPRSAISNVVIDTTGNPGSGTTSYAAIGLNDTISLTNVTVHRSGQNGIYVNGQGNSFNNVHVSHSVQYGLYIDNDTRASGSRGISLNSFTVDSGAIGGVAIYADSVQLSSCKVTDNGTTNAHHGIATLTTIPGVVISSCDIYNNAGNGVNNFDLASSNGNFNANQIVATGNYWGNAAGPTVPGRPAAGEEVSYNVSTAAGFCSVSCSGRPDMPVGSGGGTPSSPAMPVTEYVWQRSRRTRRRRRKS